MTTVPTVDRPEAPHAENIGTLFGIWRYPDQFDVWTAGARSGVNGYGSIPDHRLQTIDHGP
jgi:hypothetical protein